MCVGNTEGNNTQATNLFWQPVPANSIRIVPTAWEGNIVLRFELLGCVPWSTILKFEQVGLYNTSLQFEG